jgi:hypothetical protein
MIPPGSKHQFEVCLHILRLDADERARRTADTIRQRVEKALRHRSTQIVTGGSSQAATDRPNGSPDL